MPISAEEVVWGYRVILGRDPESEEVMREKMASCSDISVLRDSLLASNEYVKESGSQGVLIKPIGKMRIYLDTTDKVVAGGIIDGTYETAELAYVRKRMESHWNVIDVGANYGIYTIMMAQLADHVLAFEPLAHIRALLQKTIKENGLKNVDVRSEAAGHAAAQVKLIYAPDTINQGGAYLAAPQADIPPNHAGDIVTMIPLASAARRPVNFIKIDAEGAEGLILTGAEDILREDKPEVLCEIHDHQLQKVSGISGTELIKIMGRKGYSCKAFVPGGMMPVQGSEIAGHVVNVLFQHE